MIELIDFDELLYFLEAMVLEAHVYPVGLMIDPIYASIIWPKVKMIQYKLPISGQMVPILKGGPGDLHLKVTDEL